MEWSKYDLVWPDGGSISAVLYMCLYDSCLCVFRQLLAFNPAVHQTASASVIIPTDSTIMFLCQTGEMSGNYGLSGLA